MKSLAILAILLMTALLLSASAVPIGGGVPTAVHYISHQKISEVLAKVGTNAMVSDPGLFVMINRHEAGPPEIHEHTNHVIMVIDGEATFIVGGKMVGPRTNSADGMSVYSTSMEGGETYHLSKGDIITVPAKTPHWYKDVPTKTFCYCVVNIMN